MWGIMTLVWPQMEDTCEGHTNCKQFFLTLSQYKDRIFSLTFFLISSSERMITCHTGELSQSMNTLACTVKQKKLLLCAQLITGSSESIEEVQGGKHGYYYCWGFCTTLLIYHFVNGTRACGWHLVHLNIFRVPPPKCQFRNTYLSNEHTINAWDSCIYLHPNAVLSAFSSQKQMLHSGFQHQVS